MFVASSTLSGQTTSSRCPPSTPSHPSLQIQQRIFLHAVHADLVVDVDARGAVDEAGVAHPGALLPAGDGIPLFDIELLVVAVERDDPVAVVDLDHVPVPAVPPRI